jgi:hypothetical protein
VVAVGNGTAPMAKDFVEQFAVSYPVFTDPSREVFRLAGMRRTLGLGLKTLGRGLRAMKGGFRQGRTQGDAWQQGGVLGVAPDGQVWFEHIDGSAGDHADVGAVLGALRARVA